jgi:hypothetical protein
VEELTRAREAAIWAWNWEIGEASKDMEEELRGYWEKGSGIEKGD